MDQSFDSPPRISVSKNTALSDNFAANIQNCLADVTAKLGMLISDIDVAARVLLLMISGCQCLQCFDAVGWAAERASGL